MSVSPQLNWLTVRNNNAFIKKVRNVKQPPPKVKSSPSAPDFRTTNVIGPRDLLYNFDLGKIKMESDYRPPSVQLKGEKRTWTNDKEDEVAPSSSNDNDVTAQVKIETPPSSAEDIESSSIEHMVVDVGDETEQVLTHRKTIIISEEDKMMQQILADMKTDGGSEPNLQTIVPGLVSNEPDILPLPTSSIFSARGKNCSSPEYKSVSDFLTTLNKFHQKRVSGNESMPGVETFLEASGILAIFQEVGGRNAAKNLHKDRPRARAMVHRIVSPVFLPMVMEEFAKSKMYTTEQLVEFLEGARRLNATKLPKGRRVNHS